MSLSDAEAAMPQRHTNAIPRGTEPSFQWDGNEGYITSPLLPSEPDKAFWEVLVQDWGLNAETTEIVDGSVNIRGWDSNMGGGEIQRMKYYRAQIRRRQSGERSINVEKLLEKVLKRKPSKTDTLATGNRALVVLFSDWQLGKGEGGGPEATVERICLAQDRVVERIRELRKAGRAPAYVYLGGMGDLIEQCLGHYSMQAFQTTLTRREQKDLAVYLIDRMVELLVDKFPDIQVVLTAVPGNHGENRNSSGKAFTDWLDNDDLDVFTSTYRAYLKNPERYANVSMPQFDGLLQEDLTITLDIAGVPVTFAHGHQFGKGSGGGTVGKIEAWWKGQVMGRTPAADAAILFSGHYHHFVASEGTGRQVFQCPAMDGGSKWFTSQTGANSPAGMLTVGIGLDYGQRGWGDLLII